jgi:hypothetical protein
MTVKFRDLGEENEHPGEQDGVVNGREVEMFGVKARTSRHKSCSGRETQVNPGLVSISCVETTIVIKHRKR